MSATRRGLSRRDSLRRDQAAWAIWAAWERVQAVRIDSAAISTRRRRSASEIESGGIRTTTSPSGRMIAPRSRASSVTRWPTRERRVVLAEVDADHEAAAAHLGDLGHRLDLVQQLAEQARSSAAGARASARARRRRGWPARPRRRAGCRCRCGRGRRCAAPRGRRGSPRRSLGRQRRGQRQVAAGQPLGEAEQVGGHLLLLAGEHRAGAAEAGRHLVADQQHAVVVAELAHRAQVAGRVDQHPGGALHQRLDDHRGDLLFVRRRGPARGRRRRRARRRGSGRAAAGRWSGRGRCRRPRPSRSCRRGRRRAGGRRRCGARAGRRAAAGTGRPSSARSRPRSSRSPSRRRARGPAGASSTRRPASSAAPGWERPSMVEWATLPSCCAAPPRRFLGGDGRGRCTTARRRRRGSGARRLSIRCEPSAALDHQRLFLAPALLLGERVPEVVVVELRVVHRRHRQPRLAPISAGITR